VNEVSTTLMILSSTTLQLNNQFILQTDSY